MKWIYKTMVCSISSFHLLFTSCNIVLAEEIEQVEENEEEEETQEEQTIEDTNYDAFIQNIDISTCSNQATITFYLNEEVEDAAISVTGTMNMTIECPVIENQMVTFNAYLPYGNYTIQSLKIRNPEESEYDLADYETGFTIEESDISVCNEISSFSPRYEAPDSSNPYYYNSDYNPFYSPPGYANCTWYAYGRAYELLGTRPNLCKAYASNWYYYNELNGYYNCGTTPKLGAICCWEGVYNLRYGHVAVVEAIYGDRMIISESNYDGNIYSYREINSDGSCWTTQNESEFKQNFLGFIYISDPSIPVSEVSLNTNTLTLEKGASSKLEATISPSNASTGTDLVWTSSNEKVATVDQDGNVQTLSAGISKITVSSKEYSDVQATCTVMVIDVTKLKGYNLTIDGNIGLNFYFDLSSDLLSQENAYIRFSINDDESISKVKIQGCEKTSNGYKFPYTVSPKEISSTITIQIMNEKDQCEKKYTYSLEKYLENYIDKYPTNTYYNLVKDILTYGYYAEDYFDYRKDIPADYLNDLSIPDLSSYKYVLETKQDNLHFVGARLILTSKPGLKLYFTGNEALTNSCVSNIDKESVSVSNEGKYQVLTISNINDMAKMFTIETDSIHLEYGIYSYGKIALNGNNEALKNLVCAMVDYNTEIKKRSDSK